jgi:hypothetical protein
MERKRSGRMTTIPQLGPEVYVDDADDITKQARATVSPLLSPVNIEDPRTSFISHGLDGARRYRGSDANVGSSGGTLSAGSPGISPQLSPHRPSNSAFSFEGGEPPGGDSGPSSRHSSRRGSAVDETELLSALDNSAWADSMRRSFTMRRPNNRGSS